MCFLGRTMGMWFWCTFHTSSDNPPCQVEKKLLATDHILRRTTVWELAIISSTLWERNRGKLSVPTGMKKKNGRIHEKYTVIRKDYCLHQNTGNKGVKQKVPVKRLRDGHWTSSASTPSESVHCEAHNTQVEFPVNQSSQLPSTTSRHRASLAQDHKHVTGCRTQPSLPFRQSGLRTEILTVSFHIFSDYIMLNAWISCLILFTQTIHCYDIGIDVAGVCKSIDDCDMWFTARRAQWHQYCGLSEA